MMRTLPLLLVVLAACGDGKKDAAEQLAGADTAAVAGYVVDLTRYDMPLEVDLGDLATLGVDSALVKWNEEFGWLEVKAGDRFGITISEEPGDLARMKADLERSTLQTHEVMRDSVDRLVYRSQFPDEALVFHHFYRVVMVGDRAFVVQDGPNGRYNEMDVLRMVNAVRARVAS
jgi:hypothetical protein